MNNICFIVYDFTKKGGAERASAKLANELVDNFAISFISVFNEYSENAYELNKNIRFFKVLNTKGRIFKNVFFITKGIRKIIKKQNIDIVISIDVATAFISVVSTRFFRIKLIVCDRSSCYNKMMYSKLALKVYAWFGIHMSDIYQVMTEEGKRGCLEKYHIKSKKIVVIPNWIDEKAITNKVYCHNNKKIISVGRATQEKNYEELINIAEKIKPHCEGWEWHIWGDFNSEYGKGLLKLIERKKLNGFLIYKGITNNLYIEYPKYSLLVMTSRFEGMPNVILEAQGSKLPVISYDCKTGPSELIIDGVNGFLVKLNDTETMCKKILCLIKDKNLAEKISFMSNINYKKYSKEVILNKWNTILGE